MLEKEVLLEANEAQAEFPKVQSRRPSRWVSLIPFMGIALIVLHACSTSDSPHLIYVGAPHDCTGRHTYTSAEIDSAKCPAQPAALDLGPHWDPVTDKMYADLAARRLSQAVQIRTESYDDMPLDPTDTRWDKMNAFTHMLQVEFPKVFNALDHEFVNTHGHLFTWKGKNESLQPILLMAHVDTVPVLEDTVKLWRYPPFEGTVSVNGTDDTPGTWVWGRGSSDCKNSLMGILGAVERLVTEEYTPERSVVLAFGFDEEVGFSAKGLQKWLMLIIDWRYSRCSSSYESYGETMGKRLVHFPDRRRVLGSFERLWSFRTVDGYGREGFRRCWNQSREPRRPLKCPT
jgi:hypothetical protein